MKPKLNQSKLKLNQLSPSDV